MTVCTEDICGRHNAVAVATLGKNAKKSLILINAGLLASAKEPVLHMAKIESKSRTVLESLAVFDPIKSSPLPQPSTTSFRSLAISTVSDSQVRIYIGTNTGNVVLLSLNPNLPVAPVSSNGVAHRNSTSFVDSDSISKNVSFLRSVSVSSYSVDSIHVLPQLGKILVVSDGSLFFLDFLLLQPVKKLGLPKGATVVAPRLRSASTSDRSSLSDVGVNLSETTSSSHRFLQKLGSGIRTNGAKNKESDLQREGGCTAAVAVGKRLILVELLGNRVGRNDKDTDSSSGSCVILKEIQGVDGVKTMAWIDDSIIVGTINCYSSFSCITGLSTPIFSLPDPSTPPLLKLLSKDHKVLVLVDNVGIIVNANGQPVGGSLVFRHVPDSIGDLSSYLIVVRDGKMMLYHRKSGNCVQLVSFAAEGIGPCIVANEENGNGKLVAVATPTKVCNISTTLTIPLDTMLSTYKQNYET